jgi:2-alkyl-3-oxoalkanoate reductase
MMSSRPSTIAVTGASGFLGRELVTAATEAGHRVIRVERSHLTAPDDGRLSAQLSEADAIVDAGSAISAGVSAERERFGRLLEVAQPHEKLRLVVVSSLSVIDFAGLAPGTQIDEHSPTQSQGRDAYSMAKLNSEEVCRGWAIGRPANAAVIVRPGPILGNARPWTARLGVSVARGRWIAIGNDAFVPWIHVKNCACALARLAVDDRPPETVHLMQRSLPTQRALTDRLVQSRRLRAPLTRVSLSVWEQWAERAAKVTRLLRHRPAALSPDAIAARFRPFQYDGHLSSLWTNDDEDRAGERWLEARRRRCRE